MTYSATFTAERRPRSFRAILIDPWARTVAEGWQSPGLRELYATLSGPGFPVADEFPTDPAEWGELEPVDCIDIRSVGNDRAGKPIDLICDDEGRLKDCMAAFRMGDSLLIAGRALLASHDDEGETVGTALELHDARKPIHWAPWDTDTSPPPMKFTASQPGESWDELLERAAREHLADGL
jgi:hypothetical protein